MLILEGKALLQGQVSTGDLLQMRKSRLTRKIQLKTHYIQELQIVLDAEKQALAKTHLAHMIRDLKKEISKEIKEAKKLAQELQKLEEAESND